MNRLTARSLAAAVCMIGSLFAVAGTSGCGQKGPLFWPQEKLEELEQERDEQKPAKTGLLPGTLRVIYEA